MHELFVYYRVAAADVPRCRAAVREIHTRLRGEVPGLRSRLLVRPVTSAGPETWMETYAMDLPSPHGIDAALAARIEAAAAALAPMLQGPRHIEVFVAQD